MFWVTTSTQISTSKSQYNQLEDQLILFISWFDKLPNKSNLHFVNSHLTTRFCYSYVWLVVNIVWCNDAWVCGSKQVSHHSSAPFGCILAGLWKTFLFNTFMSYLVSSFCVSAVSCCSCSMLSPTRGWLQEAESTLPLSHQPSVVQEWLLRN